jgi:heptosyltransferase-3
MRYWLSHFFDRYIGIFALLLLKVADILLPAQRTSSGNFNKILVIKFSLLGDTVLLAPAVRELKRKFPHSHIDMLCTSINRGIVKKWGEINETIIINSLTDVLIPPRFFKIVCSLRRKKYDLVLDFEEWFRITALITYLTGAKKRVGFKTEGQYRHYLYTDTVDHGRNKHEVECFLDIIRMVGVENPASYLELSVDNESLRVVCGLLEKNEIARDRFIIVHPGCGRNGRRRQWMYERYAEFVNFVMKKYDVGVVITGSADDADAAENVASLLEKACLNLAGKTSLEELIALVSVSKIVVCGNSGAMHIASALNRPLIALHGPTNPIKWGPRNKNAVVVQGKNMKCIPCLYLGFEYACSDGGCMKLIDVAEVKEAFEKLWR